MRSIRPQALVTLTLLAVAALVAGCSSGSQADEPAAGSKSGGALGSLFSSTKPVALPAGTVLSVVLDQTLASDQNRSGDRFEATVAAPVVLDGRTVIPKGATVTGTVVEARESGRLKTVARLRLALQEVRVDGKSYDLETNTLTFTGKDHKKRNIGFIGGGTGAGAAIGAIAGGGKGAAIGAAVGAGAGTATAAATGKLDIKLPVETKLTFKLTQDVTVQVKS